MFGKVKIFRNYGACSKAHIIGTYTNKSNFHYLKIKRRLNQENVWYHLVQNVFSSHLLSKNIKNIIPKTIILPVVLYRCETWSLILREEHRPGVFQNRVSRRTFGPKRNDIIGDCKKLHNEEINNLHFHHVLLEWSNQGWWEIQGVQRIWDRREVHAKFW
jgi:hypothetical protein